MSHAARTAVACGALAALALLGSACTSPSTSGVLHSEGGVLGTWDFAPTSCRGGGGLEFNGVDLSDRVRNVRLVNDPAKGYLVTVSPDGDPARPAALFTPANCTRFFATVVGDPAQDATGRLDLECVIESGGVFGGSVTFASCGS